MLKEIEYKELVENKYNPRKRFDDAEMVELTESIKKIGLLEPLVVRKVNGKYEVICGIRRYRALGHINNGDKVPCNVVEVDDHQAMVMSFTENYERVNFNPVEEARFFANALGIDSPQLGGILPTHDNKIVQQLAKDLPASAHTIERRLHLLALPEKVQEMVEQKSILIGVAEAISRLRQIDNEKKREIKMLAYAKTYAGDKPNLEELHDKIETDIKLDKEETNADQQKLSEYEKLEFTKREELQKILMETSNWYNDEFVDEDDTVEIDIESEQALSNVEDFIDKLEEKATLTTDKTFKELVTKQVRIEDDMQRLEMNYRTLKREHGWKCPFCFGIANMPKMKQILTNMEEEAESLKEQQADISESQQKAEEYRKKLNKATETWKNILEKIKSLKVDDNDENNSSISD